jgi:hypothetical protein
MKKLILLSILGLVTGSLAGCGSGSSPTGVSPGGSSPTVQGSPEDRAQVVAEANRHPEFLDEQLTGSAAGMSNQFPVTTGALSTEAAITPITFSRNVRVTNQQFEFAFADTDTTGRPTTATLTVHKELTGTLTIVAADTTGGFNAPVRITKPITENWTRRLAFVRVSNGGSGGDDGEDDDSRAPGKNAITESKKNKKGKGTSGRWKLVGVSAVEVDSPNGAVDLVSLRFEADGVDTTITDPLGFFDVASLPLLAPGTQVRVTATTSASDDIVLLLTRDRRIRLQPNGGNSYTGTFTVPGPNGSDHFGVTALSHDTLFDDTAPYDSQSWVLPFRAGSNIPRP